MLPLTWLRRRPGGGVEPRGRGPEGVRCVRGKGGLPYAKGLGQVRVLQPWPRGEPGGELQGGGEVEVQVGREVHDALQREKEERKEVLGRLTLKPPSKRRYPSQCLRALCL